MAKMNKTTTSFKIFEVPEDSQENGRKITREYGITGITVQQFLSKYGSEKKSSRITGFPRGSKSEESLEASTSTTTPETLKLSPIVPNAPMKPPRISKKVDMTRKKLQFMEEAESQSEDSVADFNTSTLRYPTRACKNKISENVKPHNSKAKALQATRTNSRKNRPDVDKENDGSLVNVRQNEPINRQQSQKSLKNSTKPMNSQNRLIPEGDFAHIRI